ncbi:polymer-forming cytoskeletal protein [Gemmatimonas aurantiaca]|uniref:bactofilin family protein n=1 Tax=Gemmatimonas aurantiaca TaxID=173480 RepID=UPI00301D1BDF
MTSPTLTFALLLLALLVWMSVPLIPAVMELVRPRDAAPLDAVGNDAGNLTYFAESFTARATREGLLGTMVPPRLSDGTEVRTHSVGQPLPKQRGAFEEFVVLMDSEPLPEGTELASECLARLTVRGSPNVTYRALLGQRDIYLAPGSMVQRWVHSRGRLEVANDCQLWGRATADRQIILGTNVAFERLESDVIRVTDVETAETPVLPTGAYERFVPRKARELGPAYWRVEDGVSIPAGNVLIGSLIATGSIVVNDGARITGSIKAHGEIIVRNGAVIVGSISARDRVTIERGARVSGPVISETAVVVEAAVIGGAGKRTTVTAPIVRLLPGATIYGAVMAAADGMTVS